MVTIDKTRKKSRNRLLQLAT